MESVLEVILNALIQKYLRLLKVDLLLLEVLEVIMELFSLLVSLSEDEICISISILFFFNFATNFFVIIITIIVFNIFRVRFLLPTFVG